MESFGAMSNAVVSDPVGSLVDSPPPKRRNVGPGRDIPTNWDGKVATLVEAQTIQDSLMANTSVTEGRG